MFGTGSVDWNYLETLPSLIQFSTPKLGSTIMIIKSKPNASPLFMYRMCF